MGEKVIQGDIAACFMLTCHRDFNELLGTFEVRGFVLVFGFGSACEFACSS